MNEHKIRLIADQATEWCQKNAHGAPTAWEWETKFAELIVKECVDGLRLEGELGKIQTVSGPSGIYKLAFMNEAANIIKEHFGIEK